MRFNCFLSFLKFKLIFIAACVGGEIVSTFGRPELVRLGECKLIEEVMIGEDKVSFAEVCFFIDITRILSSLTVLAFQYFPDFNPVHSLVLICVAGKYIHLFACALAILLPIPYSGAAAVVPGVSPLSTPKRD